ncbi:hypothetical protein E1B28_000244 [Marasmius oreades]|uniref:Uncharacterized protein n=1 Tax=Marasmius oreades TaxID=181124 RepID=A0A9P7V116_9AGAR|nr:uncharacterized protein E1B28_000244 [Marasmius oreades]KAG7098281.1 hypothetical protein E1B28_000244 [Marasmius oreades]
MVDASGEDCLIVKNGDRHQDHATGIESHNDGHFSAPRDSGSVVTDANGRIVGMITGGTGLTGSTDITYVTPYYFLDECIKKVFPNSYLFPITDSTKA